MSSQYPPLTCREVKIILKKLGFVFDRQRGSHEQWSKGKYRVTVDCPKQPFSHTLIKYMAKQAGISKDTFYKALTQSKDIILD